MMRGWKNDILFIFTKYTFFNIHVILQTN
jgi:hypothetical protein